MQDIPIELRKTAGGIPVITERIPYSANAGLIELRRAIAVEAEREYALTFDPASEIIVTVGASRNHFVFLVPVNRNLNLKKAAKAVGEKSVEMIPQKDLLPLTGYVHGGCSPIGMKKPFRTVIDASAGESGRILFSGGKIGWQVGAAMEDLPKVLAFELCDISE